MEGDAWDAAAARNELWNARDRAGAHGHALLLMTLDLGEGRTGREGSSRSSSARRRRVATCAGGPRSAIRCSTTMPTRSVEATALSVQALAGREPNHPVLERAVRWLLANRGSGSYW